MMGSEHFNEVFFEDVRVPARQPHRRREPRLVHRHDDARPGTQLHQPRSHDAEHALRAHRLRALSRRCAPARNSATSSPNARIEFEIGRWLCYRVARDAGEGKIPNSEASVSKVFGTELQRQMGITGLRVVGMPGLLEPDAARAAPGPHRTLGDGGAELHHRRRHQRSEPQHRGHQGPWAAAGLGAVRFLERPPAARAPVASSLRRRHSRLEARDAQDRRSIGGSTLRA